MSAPTRLFVSGLLPGVPSGTPGSIGSSGPVGTGPRLELRSPVPGPRLLPSPSPLAFPQAGDPGKGSDAAQSGCQTASIRCPDTARVARPAGMEYG